MVCQAMKSDMAVVKKAWQGALQEKEVELGRMQNMMAVKLS